MPTPDDLTGAAAPESPLGRPLNRPPAEPDEGRWVPVDPATPHIERNTVTGRYRNVRPTPPA